MKRIVTLIFCLILLVGHAAQTGAGGISSVGFDQQAIRLPAAVVNFPGGVRLLGQTSTVQVPESPAPAKRQDAEVRLKPLTYLLLALSVAVGPIVILLLFRKKRP